MGDGITEADWRLFTTPVRFDAVYVGHFECNRYRVAETVDFAHIKTVDFAHIKRHYCESHTTMNPMRVVPCGPELDLDAPHGRDEIGGGR